MITETITFSFDNAAQQKVFHERLNTECRTDLLSQVSVLTEALLEIAHSEPVDVGYGPADYCQRVARKTLEAQGLLSPSIEKEDR